MTFHAFGLNHETAPVQVREAFSLDEVARRTLYGLFQLSPEAVSHRAEETSRPDPSSSS